MTDDIQERLMDKLLDFQREAFSVANGYEQILIGVGFAGFITIWSQTAPHLPRNSVLLSGALIGISLLGYVGFHILQTGTRARSMRRLGKRLQAAPPEPHVQLAIFQEEAALASKDSGLVMTVWPVVFGVTVLCSVAAALIVVATTFWAVVDGAIS